LSLADEMADTGMLRRGPVPVSPSYAPLAQAAKDAGHFLAAIAFGAAVAACALDAGCWPWASCAARQSKARRRMPRPVRM